MAENMTAPRRPSILTELMARSSTSSSFIDQSIKPTVVIAMLYLTDPTPDIDRLREVLGKRLLQIPRFSSIFRLDKDNKVYEHRIPNEDVDLEHHIQTIDGKGTFNSDDISKMISTASQEWWDASLPLWNLTLVTNTADGKSVLFCKIDHTLGDGVAMVHVLKTLLDDGPDGDGKQNFFQSRRPNRPKIKWSTQLVWFISGIYDGLIGWMVQPNDPENNLKIPKHKTIGEAGCKTFTVTQTHELATIKKMTSALSGASINDVIMATVTIGIRRYLERTNDPILSYIDKGKKKLQAMSLVNLRGVADNRKEEDGFNLGNDFATLNFPLPLNYKSEVDAVWKIKNTMDYYKTSPAIYLIKACGLKLLSILPEQALIQASLETIRKPSCIISNVMGPPIECQLAGYSVDSINFLVSSAIGLYVGLISYNGKVTISFATDELAKIDCGLLQECLEGSMSDMKKFLLSNSQRKIEQPDMTSHAAKFVEYSLPVMICVCVGWLYMSYFA